MAWLTREKKVLIVSTTTGNNLKIAKHELKTKQTFKQILNEIEKCEKNFIRLKDRLFALENVVAAEVQTIKEPRGAFPKPI